MTKLICVLIAIVLFYLSTAFILWDLTPDFSAMDSQDRLGALGLFVTIVLASLAFAYDIEQ